MLFNFRIKNSFLLLLITFLLSVIIMLFRKYSINSVVTRDIPDYSIAYGSPAKVVGSTLELDRKFLDENPALKETYYDVEKTI